MSDIPNAAVQVIFWYVIAALALIATGAVGLMTFARWFKGVLGDLIVEKIKSAVDVAGAVEMAMKRHEDRESARLDSDRREWRAELRDLQAKVDRITERWLDKALQLLQGDGSEG